MASSRYFQNVFAFMTAASALAALVGLDALTPARAPELITLLLGTALTLAAGRFSVPLRSTNDKNQAITVSLRFVATLFLIATQRNWNCVWIVAAASLPEFHRSHPNRERRWYNLAFSITATALSLAVAQVTAKIPLEPFAWIVADTLAVAAVYHLAHVTLISAAMASHSQRTFTQNFRFLYQTALGYATGAALVAAGRLSLAANPNPVSLLPIAGLAIPVAVTILREQTLRRERDDEHARRLEEQQAYISELEQRRSELQLRQSEIEEMYASTVEAFALAIDAKDRYTQEHIQRVKKVAVAVAHQMGLQGDQLRAIEVGAALHDIGKIAIPEHILNKPGRLNPDEFDVIKRHAEMGARILQPVHFPYPVLGVVRSHHEKWDGTGYPDALAGEDIPLGGRILAVADVYDALTSDRPYRESWDHERAAEYLTQQSGIHFDPDVVDAFHRAMAEDPALKAMLANQPNVKPTVGTEINRAAFEYRAVYAVSNILTEVHDIAGIVQAACETLAELYDAKTCAVLLQDRGTLSTKAVAGTNTHHFANAVVDQWNGPTAETFLTGQGRCCQYESADLLLTAATTPWAPLKSCMIAPIRTENGTVVGTVNLYSQQESRFQPEDLRVLEALATLLAHGIENIAETDSRHQSRGTDLLTNLPNREHFEQIVETAKQESTNTAPFTLVVIDLAQFRDVNRKFGYETGNAILRAFEPCLSPALPSGSHVARLDSDHFAVLVPRTDSNDTTDWESVVQQQLRNMPPLQFASGAAARLAIHTGAARFPEEPAPDLITAAWDRLEKARNRKHHRNAA